MDSVLQELRDESVYLAGAVGKDAPNSSPNPNGSSSNGPNGTSNLPGVEVPSGSASTSRSTSTSGTASGAAFGSLIASSMDSNDRQTPATPSQLPTKSKPRPEKFYLSDLVLDGVVSFRPGFLASVLMPYVDDDAKPWHWWWLSGLESQTSLNSVISKVQLLQMQLGQFDVFDKVDVTLDTPDVNEPENIQAILNVKEKPRKFLKTSTEVGNNDGSFTIQGRLRNALGGAEIVEADMAFGYRTHEAYTLRFDTPIQANPFFHFDITAAASERTLSPYAQCSESRRNLMLRLRFLNPIARATHELWYDAILRTPTKMLPSASMSLRREAVLSVKSAFNYVFTRDTRDNPIMPMSGSYFRFKQELAGFGGDAHHSKTEVESSVSSILANGILSSSSARFGILLPFPGSSSLFADRFQLGGPLSVRMFRQNSLGPHDHADSLGGDVYYALGTSLFTDVPRRPEWPLKVHFFGNMGGISRWESSIKATTNKLTPSISAGLGLVYINPGIRVEMNWGVPLVAHSSDGPASRFQLGIGLDFL